MQNMGFGLGELVHWYDISGCVLDCPGCFRQEGLRVSSLKRRKELARILVDNGVKQVNSGNGEPLLVPGLEEVLAILHEAGVKTEIHTNAVLLDQRKINQLAPVTDVIALPIDSLRPEVQQRIRGNGFMPVFDRFQELVKQIQGAGMQVGYHTVFTAINQGDIQDLYSLLSQNDFKYWRIYEFNKDLPMQMLGRRFLRLSKKDQNGILGRRIDERAQEIERFAASPRDMYLGELDPRYNGDIECLFAYFILKEREMQRHRDKRVQFVGVHDPNNPPYIFLDGQGDVTTYMWFGGGKRPLIGNLFKDGFSKVKARLVKLEKQQMGYCARAEEDFIEMESGRPLWARSWEGNFWDEELEEGFDKRHLDRFLELADLYAKRQRRLERAA